MNDKLGHTQVNYIYIFVRTDISFEAQCVQAAHAAIESARNFLNPDAIHPHLVICGLKSEKTWQSTIAKLDGNGIKYQVFIEPDLDNIPTAIATEPISGDLRKPFSNYQLLRFGEIRPVGPLVG